jgi:hypothetical protein
MAVYNLESMLVFVAAGVGFAPSLFAAEPLFVTPAALVVDWSNDVKYKSAIGGSKESQRHSY